MTVERASRGEAISFQQVPEPKSGKDGLHLDFTALDEEAAATWIGSLGATRRWVSDKPNDPFVVLPIPKGTSSAWFVRTPDPSGMRPIARSHEST